MNNKKCFIKNILIIILICALLTFTYFTYVYNIEGYVNNNKMNQLELTNLSNFGNSWCKSNSGSNLDNSCKKMSQSDCNNMSCCVWGNINNSESCLAGNQSGALFGEKLNYYYYQGKCYGTNCP
jgi:hypothetical protein